jgi:predicted dehydrogenase
VYPIPPNASEQTIDWAGFLDGAPKRPFSPERFFRWRCFTDYGEGLAGDLFVHLISGIHFITGTNTIAKRAQSAGGLFRWKDGREFPDLIETMYDYPNFRVHLRCNLNNNQDQFIGFFGTKGTLVMRDTTLTYTPQDTRPRPEDYSIFGWPKALREEYLEQFEREHPMPQPLNWKPDTDSEAYALPPGYSDVPDHQANFFNAVRSRKKTVENEEFGNNAALGCHLANYSYFKETPAIWDGAAKKIKS